MVFRKFLVLSFLLVLCVNLIGQVSSKTEATIYAQNELLALQAGYLLIRIENYGNAIDELQRRGQYTQANELIEKAKIIEAEYLTEVPKHYTYSKYLFFYSSDADKLIKQYDFSVLFDANKERNTNLEMNIEGLFICTKERRSYTVLTLRQDFHVYKLDNNRLKRLSKPFPTEMDTPNTRPLIAFWKKLRFDDEVIAMNSTLSESLPVLK